MFDFSPLAILVAFMAAVGGALSTVTIAALAVAVACVLLALVLSSPGVRVGLLGLAVAALIFALAWQSAVAEGARSADARGHALALRAEAERVEAAEAISRDLAEQATRDLADAQADATNLKDLTHALAQDPRRDRVCLDRGIARRLRGL